MLNICLSIYKKSILKLKERSNLRSNSMSSKGQTGLAVLFVLAILGVVYFAGLAGTIGALCSSYIVTSNLTGLDAWFFANINFVIIIGYILALLGVGYFGLR
jgi:hypothetical protein